jgi:uncharacterized membrane protein (UPF0127 family)
MSRILPVALICALIVSVFGFAQPALGQREQVPPWRIPMPAARATAEIVVGETPLTVEVAVSSREQQLGLGYRNGLEPGTGMLFVFQEPSERVFSMRGMRFCLDIVWIANGEIVGAAENACPDPEETADADRARYSSEEAVTHVLEVPAGWLADNGYGPGTRARNPNALD